MTMLVFALFEFLFSNYKSCTCFSLKLINDKKFLKKNTMKPNRVLNTDKSFKFHSRQIRDSYNNKARMGQFAEGLMIIYIICQQRNLNTRKSFSF